MLPIEIHKKKNISKSTLFLCYLIHSIYYYYYKYIAVSRVGKMKQILHSDWLPEQERWVHLAHSGFPAFFSHEKVLFLAI